MVRYGVLWCVVVSHHFNMVSSFLSFSPFKKLACVKKSHCCIETIHMSNMWSFIKFECDPNAENSLHMTSCKNSSHSKISFLAKYVFYFCWVFECSKFYIQSFPPKLSFLLRCCMLDMSIACLLFGTLAY